MKDVLVFTGLMETFHVWSHLSVIDVYKQLNLLILLELCHSLIRHGWLEMA